MAVNYVTITCDLYNGSGQPDASGGFLYFSPSSTEVDSIDGVTLSSPVGVEFQGQVPQISLAATDNANFAPSGWSWKGAFGLNPEITDPPAAFTFFLPAGPAAFTATHASPAVFTWTPTTALTAIANGTSVQLSGGSLPGGFSAATTYYVVSSSGSTFSLAATLGGAGINSTGTGSGNVAVTGVFLSSVI
jgi:hypothetical protein